jgi:hypothetical protein
MTDTDPDGCPACNPAQILPWLDRHRLVALDVPASNQGAHPCDRCGKYWWVVSLETAETPTNG